MVRSTIILIAVMFQAAGCCSVTGGGGGLPPTCAPSCNPGDCILASVAAPGVMAATDTTTAEVPLPSAFADAR
jgi:hypothetical protein